MKMLYKQQTKKLLKSLKNSDYSHLLPDDANEVDKIKFELCKMFVLYLKKTSLSQTELADKLSVNKSRINWIVKYRIENFSIDYLYTLLKKLNPNVSLRISAVA